MNLDQTLKEIKHSFMTFRNGIVADTLRKSGMPYKIIFGLQIPQLSQIASTLNKDLLLGEALWKDSDIRESRLLACWIFPIETIDYTKALSLANGILTREEADILCFRLLRYHPDAMHLSEHLLSSENAMTRYCGEALKRNLDSICG